MNSDPRPRSASLVATAVAFVLAQSAAAQTMLGEVTVTARKRAESLQDVPFAVSARTQETLRQVGATSIEDISRNIAGLSVQNLGPGQSQVGLRGISAGKIDRDLAGIKEQVGVYMDESVISLSLFTPDLELYDLNRVEVLRGPQGTLFGSGSLAGTVRYISNQPDTSDDYGSVEVGMSTIDGGDTGGDVRGMLNIAMGDAAALRLVGYYNEIPGYIEAHRPGGVVADDVNGGTRYGGRAALRLELSENVTITPRVIYQSVNTDGVNREDVWNMLANPFMTTEPAVLIGEREQYTNFDEKFSDDFLLGDLTMEFDLGGVMLTSISSYTDRDILMARDATQLSGSITYFNYDNVGSAAVRLNSQLLDVTEVEVFTQELRLASDYEGRFQWVVGGFYSDITRDYGQTLPTPGFDTIVAGAPSSTVGAPPDTPFFSVIPYDFKQIAFFAEGTFDITERFSATIGGRYYDFDEDRTLYFAGHFADIVRDANGDVATLPGSTSEDGFLPRLLLAYDVSDNVQLNAQAAKGFRLGGINDPLNVPLCSANDLIDFSGRPTFDSESLWNYELGAKLTFADGRAQLNMAVFHADIEDLQVPALAGNCSSRIAINVPESHSSGVEMELTAQPTDRFDFGISATYTQSEIDTSVTSVSGAILAGIEEGNRLPSTPEFQLSANATYSWPMTDRVDGFITGVYQHVGSRFTQMGDQVPGFDTFGIVISPPTPGVGFGNPLSGGAPLTTFSFEPELPAYDLGNLRFGVRGDDWEAALFINNVGDENAKLALDQERGRVARTGYLVNQPRTFGLSFRKDFGGEEPAPAPLAAPPPPPPAPAPPPPPPPPPGDEDKDGVTDDKDRCPGTPVGVAVDAIGCFKEITLRGMVFEFDSEALTAETRGMLDGLVEELRNRPADIVAGTKIVVEGHTDSVGSDAYNQGLSQRRAESVRQYLIDKGLNASMIVATGAGETSPTDSNETAEGRHNNRRVVIKATR